MSGRRVTTTVSPCSSCCNQCWALEPQPRARGMTAHAEASSRAGAPLRQLAAAAPGCGMQYGGGQRCWTSYPLSSPIYTFLPAHLSTWPKTSLSRVIQRTVT